MFLYGSLAKTGKGHGTDIAVMMGLSGEDYTRINTDDISEKVAHIKSSQELLFAQQKLIPFIYENNKKRLCDDDDDVHLHFISIFLIQFKKKVYEQLFKINITYSLQQ